MSRDRNPYKFQDDESNVDGAVKFILGITASMVIAGGIVMLLVVLIAKA